MQKASARAALIMNMSKINNIVLIDKLSGNKKFIVRSNQNSTFIIFLDGQSDQSGSVSIIIDGKNAKVQILGLILGSGNQKINLYTLQDHQKEQSVSDLLVKSVLFGNSRFNYEGLIKIEKNAQKSNAYQKNQNILMSDKSWADSRPKLEILANDVRCTHGATIGKIDQSMLYYLESRGLSKSKSEMLVLEGFFQEVLDRIPDKKIADQLSKELNLKIHGNLFN